MSSNLKNLSAHQPDEIPSAKDHVFGIVVSEWNTEITGALLEGVMDILKKAGAKEYQIKLRYVPGTFELPYGALQMILREDTDVVICLGCVIQGETRHFEFICNAAANGIMNVSLEHSVPVVFGVLTTDNLQQAIDRSGGKHGNKGVEAALTALKLLSY
jgi:6,7-dimethyl-8-ribityllumazine synthase